MSDLARTDELFFTRAGLDRARSSGSPARRCRAPTTASCSSNTASRKAWRSTTAS